MAAGDGCSADPPSNRPLPLTGARRKKKLSQLRQNPTSEGDLCILLHTAKVCLRLRKDTTIVAITAPVLSAETLTLNAVHLSYGRSEELLVANDMYI